MNSSEWALAVAVLAVAIAKNRSVEDIEFLAVIFTQLGDTLATIAITPPHIGEVEGGEGAIL